MKFTTILSALALGAFSQLVSAAPAPAPAAHHARDVWDPHMTYPTAETVWQSGQTYTVTW